MRIRSVNVALPRLVAWKGQTFTTGIFKEPIQGPVMMRTLDLDGDRQADLSVHGGPYKAVYAYPVEHYSFWRTELPEIDLKWGAFGENLTTEGLDESSTHIGDRFRIGAATVMVTQPRVPCFKLAAKFQRDDILKRFLVERPFRLLFFRGGRRPYRRRRHDRTNPRRRKRNFRERYQ